MGGDPTLDRLEQIVAACDRFEAEWRSGCAPRIEDHLGETPEFQRPAVLRALLELELELRRSVGEYPAPAEYLARFPDQSALIGDVFVGTTMTDGQPGRIAIAPVGPGASTQGPEPVDASGQLLETRSLLKPTVDALQFGRYRPLRILGEGAFGRVHLAFDEELRRRVAVKVPTPERFHGPEDMERYLAEARTVATLDHPHIVPVFDVGRTADGSVYVVSKFIEGVTLADRLKDRMPAEEASRLIAIVAVALDHAHRKRLIHRDIKPANILIEEQTGTPYVADFGLAISEEASISEQRVAGTPAYMSPEQIRGEGHRLDGRSDIFSLGVVLYELLTGRKPFRGGTTMEVFHQVVSVDPPAPRTLDGTVPAELERICLKALSKRASDRYATATELAGDLSQWRQGPQESRTQVTIIPRGLRSFGPDDADFFLDLLPGPRGRDGLPESIRFWKTRIEESDPDKTFDVGLIYGPSGCGKSSLMKAGLLPHLSPDITAVYVESTFDETESRILRGLRRRIPELPANLGLVETFAMLRRGGAAVGGRRVLVVMDQFEQWLHAWNTGQEAELVNALRQCDGAQLQAIVMVRDDFSMAASRLMRQLETPILEGHNFATIDLFDEGHAAAVLAKFGRAFGRLPDQPDRISADERHFLDAVVKGLAQDSKVVSVRLALFAEMIKDKPWISSTLDEVGGTEGIGVNFLEETFAGRRANPEHRLHQRAAREVLKALLPEVGTEIKGHMRSHDELLEASGYHDRPGEFRDLLRILDGALRLITPTDPDGGRSDSGSDPGSKYFQLTHDYMVPSLREWLTRKQKETRHGRAELQLTELAALWHAKPEDRRLPDWNEYRSLRRLTDPKKWTGPQREMMRHAARYHARATVRRLLEADLASVPDIVAEARWLRRWTEPLLRRRLQNTQAQGRSRLNTAMALLANDEAQLGFLSEQLLQATPAEFPILRDFLAEHREALRPGLWGEAEGAEVEERRLRAAAALAVYDGDDPGWRRIGVDSARLLVHVKPEFLGDWMDAFRPVKAALLGPLGILFRDRELGELQRSLATAILADYAASDPVLLADLLADADPGQFAELSPVLARHGEAAIAALERELDREARPEWAEAPTAPDRPEVAVDLQRLVESAAGLLDEHFAFCQAMPLERFIEIVDRLRPLGYRPTRIRPYRLGPSEMVAAIWTRDDRDWQWMRGAEADRLLTRDRELRGDGYCPIDVSVAPGAGGPSPCYTVVWERSAVPGVEHRLDIGPIDERPSLADEGWNCQAFQMLTDDGGRHHGATLWTRRADQQKSTTRLFHDLAEHFREDECPGLLLSDVRLDWVDRVDPAGGDTTEPALVATALWNISTEFESRVIHGQSVMELRLLAAELAEAGYRPASLSVAAGPGHGLPVASVVWHRPLVPEEARDRLAKRQANTAVALLGLGKDQRVWPMLRHRPDPRARSYLIHRFAPLQADPGRVLERLDAEADASIRRALILALGEFDEHHFPTSRREAVIPSLLGLYADDPDSGIHGATAWTLRRWGRQAELEAIDRRFATGAPVGDRRWIVNGQGRSLALVPPPGTFLIGSPPTEVGREGGPEGDVEMQRHARIDYAFALMTHTVTVADFLQFRGDYYYRNTFSTEPDCPINNLSWYEAAAYCNWLNEQEGIPRDEWCYLPNDDGMYDQGMKIVPDCLGRRGYRLPTEAEWEYACRAGSVTSRYYGQSPDLDDHYAWTVRLALGRGTTSVGRFKPNDLGMFDMMGNIMEWIHDAYHDPSSPAQVRPPDDRDGGTEVVVNQQMRSLRPSCYTSTGTEYTRSAAREVSVPPNARVLLHSLRVGRTWADPDTPNEEAEVRDDQQRVLMGAPVMHSSGFIRCSYRSRGYSPNFKLFAWGLRAARTLS